MNDAFLLTSAAESHCEATFLSHSSKDAGINCAPILHPHPSTSTRNSLIRGRVTTNIIIQPLVPHFIIFWAIVSPKLAASRAKFSTLLQYFPKWKVHATKPPIFLEIQHRMLNVGSYWVLLLWTKPYHLWACQARCWCDLHISIVLRNSCFICLSLMVYAYHDRYLSACCCFCFANPNYGLFLMHRLLLLDRDRQANAVAATRGVSPPPTYRSHAGTLLRLVSFQMCLRVKRTFRNNHS